VRDEAPYSLLSGNYLYFWRVRSWVLLGFGLVWGQLYLGTAFSQQGLTGQDTVFRLSGPSRILSVEYRTGTRLPWDTLWIILRTPAKIMGAYCLYRMKSNPLVYRGQIRIRMASIYVALIVPPREYRQILRQRRFYVTDDEHPTIASLRGKAVQQASTQQASLIEDVPIESLEVPTEALAIPPAEAPIDSIDETLEDMDSLDMDPPDLEGSDDAADLELDDLDLEDL